MNLSADQNLHEQFKFIKSRSGSVSPKPAISTSENEFDIIDVSEIKFDSDETWLCKPNSSQDNPIKDLSGWLYSDNLQDEDYCINAPKHDFQKNIDTRTFTRPKKRFTRPSIEKYNEEVYGSGSDTNEKPASIDNKKRANTQGANESSRPLNFDLTQPANSYYFENILANSAEIESFQNMSPPSLVNSMCSSTFANLMDSSFIKNDPILREIRDTDYTETVLLQDSEPPMFQSITESCSSISSDTPESFLKKVSFNGTFRRSMAKEVDKTNNSTINLNTTYEKPNESDWHNSDPSNEEPHTPPFNNYNGTYRRTPKSHGTFRKSDINNATLVLNSTYEKSSEDPVLDQNTTQTLIKDCSIKSFEGKRFSNHRIINNEDTVEDMKKQLSETVQITDLNRLSYCLEDNVRLNSTYTEEDDLNRTVNMNHSALGCSTGSADSLDRMSSLSTSSRESNKMLNMADVDAIVEMQERSLQQVMSTPKPNASQKKLWENNLISPIIPTDQLSDSDPSSTDEYKSVRSSFSKTSLENYNSSQPSLYRSGNIVRPSGPTTNLKTMGQRLKGSYTSLRPISANLPVAPPIMPHMNVTTTLSRATNPNVTQNIEGHARIVQVPPMPRERVSVEGDSVFVKPQQPRASGLPRPTGIPRPASRIPGPRTNIRPTSSRSANVRRPTNYP